MNRIDKVHVMHRSKSVFSPCHIHKRVVITNSRLGINRHGCQSCSSSAEQGAGSLPGSRSRLRIWSREIGSAVPSRVSPLTESGTHGLLSSFPLSSIMTAKASICAINQQAGPEFIWSRNRVSMAFIVH